MIGVIPKPGQIAVVEEFFELFKTPWELYQYGRRYDVVIATTSEIADVDARLLLVFGSESKHLDETWGSIPVPSTARSVHHRGRMVPVFGGLSAFGGDHVMALPAGGSCSERPADPPHRRVVRIGYDLFEEVRFLISTGQPVAYAHVPTLDLHIAFVRDSILDAGIPLVEIPPAPAGHGFAICLTHDIDFVGMRNHFLDHSMWGFLYRSTIGGIRNFARRRISFGRLLKMWRAAASLPFVFLGWIKDFWDPFEWYLQVEGELPATYYLIPFKGRQGDHVPGRAASRRAAAYDVADLAPWPATLMNAGCEIGVHGIDAWHSVDRGREELTRIAAIAGRPDLGIRMHWLLQDAGSPQVLARAGYGYDSSAGYNDTIGYRSGTTQAFRPLGVQTLMELPLHIQDGALFYPHRLDLSEADAWTRCGDLIGNVKESGGVLTLLWHDRSHGPDRFWGDFYVRLIDALRATTGWFGTARQIVGWFRKRRAVRFEAMDGPAGIRLSIASDATGIQPPLTIRLHRSGGTRTADGPAPLRFVDIPWDGTSPIELDTSHPSAPALTQTELCPL